LHGHRITVDGDVGRVGEHGAVELDRQAAQHVATFVVLREHDQIGDVATVDHCLHCSRDSRARESSGKVAGLVDLDSAMISECSNCTTGDACDKCRDSATQRAGLGE